MKKLYNGQKLLYFSDHKAHLNSSNFIKNRKWTV